MKASLISEGPMLGKLVALYRRVNSIGVRELAKEIGISSATLSRIENGKDWDLPTHWKLVIWVFHRGRK